MVYDDLIIGSGLTGLAVVYGLGDTNKVCVLAGSRQPALQWYDDISRIPCANQGFGGLGAHWHGVIPMGQPSAFFATDSDLFIELFSHFYPDSIEGRYGQPWLFVPYRPIRPARYWNYLCSRRKYLTVVYRTADFIEYTGGIWTVRAGDVFFQARRIWMAAGALGTPAILERSPGLSGVVRSHVSDHVILYLGQIDRQRHPNVCAPEIERSSSGIWIKSEYDLTGLGLVTTKPARFSYATLDSGITQRSAFGLPTYGLLGKLLSAGSLGLISESLFNKFGLFPDADRLSVYAQIRIGDAYRVYSDLGGLLPEMSSIQKGINDFRSTLKWSELDFSNQPNLFIRGIHLHNSLNLTSLANSGVLNEVGFNIVDSSIIPDIGPEHHSFKSMVKAYSLARNS